MEAYMGCLIYLYGPSVIKVALADGIGEMRNLDFCIVMIAQKASKTDKRINSMAKKEKWIGITVNRSSPININ